MVAVNKSMGIQESLIGNIKNTQVNDVYDLDIEVVALSRRRENGVQPQGMALITSQSLCTPGCGNTGTMNSFCC